MSDRLSNLYKQPTPVCPHCGHVMTSGEMNCDFSDSDLFVLAPNEDTAVIKCPICDTEYWVRGGFNPHYTTGFSEEELQ